MWTTSCTGEVSKEKGMWPRAFSFFDLTNKATWSKSLTFDAAINCHSCLWIRGLPVSVVICLCCGIRYPINSIEGTSVVSKSFTFHRLLTLTERKNRLLKVSARVQDRPRADRYSAFISRINPDKSYIFWKINSPKLWLIPLKISKSKEIAYLRRFFRKHMSE